MFAAQSQLGAGRMSSLHVGTSGQGKHWTRFLWLLFFTALLHCFFSLVIPLSEDEAYYWTWAQNFSLSYFDHPPMTAWAIRFSTAIFGDNLFAIRLPAMFFSSATALLVAYLSPQPTLAALFLLTPLFLFGGALMTPDLPLVFFWTLYLTWTSRIHARLETWNCDPVTRVYHNSPISPIDWLMGGCVLGLGLLSKYTMALAVVCSALTFITRTKTRAWWKGFALHLLVAGLLGLPVLYFNKLHDFLPFKFQWNHMGGIGAFSWGKFVEFWGVQGLLVGFLPLLFLPRITLVWRYLWTDPRLQPCVVFFLFPALYFTYKSLTANLEANWVIVMYLAAWPVMQRICQISSFKTWNWILMLVAFIPAWVCSIALTIHLFAPLRFIPPYKDRIRVPQARMDTAILATEELKNQPVKAPIFLPNYQWTSLFLFNRADALQLDIGRRSHFTLSPVDPCQRDAIYYWMAGDNPQVPSELGCFTKRTVVKTYLVTVGGQKVENIEMVRLEK